MDESKNAKLFKNYLFFVILLLVPVIYFAINTAVFQVSFFNFLTISFYFIFVLLIPGVVVLNFIKYRKSNGIITMAFGLAIGFILNLVLYVLIFALGLKNLSTLFVLLYACIFLGLFIYFILIKKFIKQQDYQLLKISKKSFLIILIFSIVLFLVQFFTYNLTNLLPYSETKIYNQDNLYWIGNAVALKKGFPPTNIRAAGQSYGYHYFTSMIFALISSSMNINTFIVCSAYSSILVNYLLIFSAFIFFEMTLKKNWKIIFGLILLLFTTGFQDTSIVYYYEHLISNPFAFDYGVAFGLLTSILMVEFLKRKNLKIFDIFAIVVFFFVTAGVKIPNACILFVFLCAISLFKIIKKENWKSWCLLSLISVIVLLLGYKFLFNGYTSLDDSSNGTSIKIFDSFARLTSIYSKLLSIFKSVKISVLLTIIILPLFINPVLCALCFFAIISLIPKIKSITIIEFSALLTALGGYVALLSISHIGVSQMYYIMSVVPFLIVFGLSRFEFKFFKSVVSVIKNCLLGMALCFSVVMFVYYALGDTCRNITKNYNYGEVFSRSNEVTPERYNALLWVRDNTDEDAMLATNMTIANIGSFDFISVFSERQMLLENPAYSALSSEENNKRKSLISSFTNEFSEESYLKLKEYGVNYFFSFKYLESSEEESLIAKAKLNLNVVYESENIIIYKF